MHIPLIIPIHSIGGNIEEPNWLVFGLVLFIISTFLVIFGKIISQRATTYSIWDLVGELMKFLGGAGYITIFFLILIAIGTWLYLLLI